MPKTGVTATSLLNLCWYGLPAFAFTAVTVHLYIFLTRFYSDTIGLALSTVGVTILLSRVWDAVIDPLIGTWCDRTRSSFGRRKMWMLFALPLCCLSVFILYRPPLTENASIATIAFMGGTFLFFWSLSAFQIPYEAWGAEMPVGYEERNKLFAIRQGFFIAGTITAAALPSLTAPYFDTESALGVRQQFDFLGVIFITLLILCSAPALLFLRDSDSGASIAKQSKFLAETRSALAFKPFRVLLVAYILAGFGAALPSTLIEYYVRTVLKAVDAGPFLILYFVSGLLTLPVWIMLSRKIDKKLSWILSTGLNSGAFVGVLFLSAGDSVAYAALVTLSGLGFGGTLAIPLSMQADVIEMYQRTRANDRSEGTFMGIWSVGNKFAAAVGAGIALPLLEYAGYSSQGEQSETVILSLKALYAGIPSLCYLLSLLVICAYPLSRYDFAEQRIET
jgi:GPH family glycoside/pentoside/hexuronide:cation symporter